MRRYAYDRLADKAGVHGRLREYFEARPAPERVETLADLAPTIELYWHTVGAGRLDAAFELLRGRLIPNPLYFRFGAYERVIDLLGALFPEGEEQTPRLTSESAQSWTLNGLANSYSVSGQPGRAVPVFEAAVPLDEKLGNKRDLAIGLGNLAYMAQVPLGRLKAAEGTMRRSIELCREIEDESSEATVHQELGNLLAYEGRFADAERELEVSTTRWKKMDDQQGVCLDEAYRSLLGLLRGDPKAALATARESRRLADIESVEANIVRADWLLGWAHTALGETPTAELHLTDALIRCRRINLIYFEPSILLAWARLHQDRESAQKSPRDRRPLRVPPHPGRDPQLPGPPRPRLPQARRSPRPRPKSQRLRLLRRPAALLQTGLRRSRAPASRSRQSPRGLRLAGRDACPSKRKKGDRKV